MYIGSYKIEKEIPVGDSFTRVLFEKIGGDKPSSEIFSNEVLKVVKTKGIKDLNFVRDKRCGLAASSILKIFLKYNIKIFEISHLISVVQGSLNESLKKADEKVWGCSDLNRTVIDIDNILKN